MDELMAVKRGEVTPEESSEKAAKKAESQARHKRSAAIAASRCEAEEAPVEGGRSDVAADDNPVPVPPFWGSRITKGIALADYSSWLDERALFNGQWGLKSGRGGDGPSYDQLVETEGRPRLRELLSRVQSEGIMQAAVIHGY
ncbi:hypothetical protein QUS89_22895, partial [Xanthomonas citri pv. citri]